MSRILVVDDHDLPNGLVEQALLADGHRVEVAASARLAVAGALADPPDLVVLDVTRPGREGLEVCAALRDDTATVGVPIILMRGEENTCVAGLELGADDCLARPFIQRELTLRVRAVLRRGRPVADTAVTDGDLVADLSRRVVTRGGHEVPLTAREFDLLAFLLRHRGVTFNREQLYHDVWRSAYGDLSTVTVHVRRLREKLERDPGNPERLLTVWGTGYRYRS